MRLKKQRGIISLLGEFGLWAAPLPPEKTCKSNSCDRIGRTCPDLASLGSILYQLGQDPGQDGMAIESAVWGGDANLCGTV